MPRLRRSDTGAAGITRRRYGKGYRYREPCGDPIEDEDELARLRALVIPPAWRDVWICPWPNGHIQAVGVDAAGRRQYLYHASWRLERDRAKHDRVLDLADRLPDVRAVLCAHLEQRGLVRERVLAAAIRLLELGFFRVGGEQYAEENGSYGLATLRREHVSARRGTLVFEYQAKGGADRTQVVADPEVVAVVRALLRRRDTNPELLAYRRGKGWRDVRSDDINAYLSEVAGGEFTAKDFRTWHATVLAALALAEDPHAAGRSTPTARSRHKQQVAAIKEVAEYLGNTPAIARSSYVDPRVLELHEQGRTIRVRGGVGEDPQARQAAAERAVLRLLTQDDG